MVFSEAEAGCRYIAYIAGALANARGVCAEICAADGRIYLRARGEGLAAAEKAACERAAEVLGIGYKYAALSRLVRPAGLGREEREILLAAMIAADFPPERRYILARLQTGGERAVDGVYRFRLQTLRKKWESVAACVPAMFTRGRLEEFMRYLLGGSRGAPACADARRAAAKWEVSAAKRRGATAKWECSAAKWEGTSAKRKVSAAKWEGAAAK